MARCRLVSWGQLFCFSTFLCKGILSVEHVPMLLWSTHRSLHGVASTFHEGHVISKHELRTLLQHTISKDSRNIVLFLQDTLSVDDFTRYADSSGNETPFRNVQERLKTSTSSLVLPAVDRHAVSQLSDYFRETLNWTLVNVDDPNTSQLMGNASKPNLYVIKLQPTRRIDELSTLKELAENDKIMGRFAKALELQGIQYLAIYTARRPSKVPVKFDVTRLSRRQLMSVEEQDVKQLYPPLKVTNGSHLCILFYATNFSLITNSKDSVNLINATFVSSQVDTNSSYCGEHNATLSLKYVKPEKSINTLEIRFVMTKRVYGGSARDWFTLDSVSILQDNGTVLTFNVSLISSPAEYSFHCQLVGTSNVYGATLIPTTKEAAEWQVVISEFQIQAFNVENDRFSYASDCTSFFTPGLWMALVTTLILLLILTYGLHMIVHITTNSRFDDPKSPPLSVPQTE